MADEESREPQEDAAQNGNSKAEAASNGLASKLTSKEVLIPLAVTAATAVGTVAARKGNVGSKLKELGGEAAKDLGKKGAEGAKEQIGSSGGIGAVMSKAMPGGGGGGSNGKQKTRRLQIQRYTDIAAPRTRVFRAWTDFEEYPKFMHRVLSVEEQEDEDKVKWDEKIWFWKREWEAEIVDRRDNQFIAWKTTRGTSHAGVVSFHKLDDRLTRVLVTMDFRPSGLFEKMASGLRFVKRAVEADLARFKSYVEFQESGLEAPQERLEQVKHQQDDKGDRGSDDSENGERDAERSQRSERRAERREKATA